MVVARLGPGFIDGRVPIVLGAIGHRNIDVRDERFIAALKQECTRLRNLYKSSPFVILSSLAEGADRLIAQVTMNELSARLIAVLPLPRQDFEQDFKTEDSKKEFRRFLDRAICVKDAFAEEAESWKSEGDVRNRQYARAGAVIVDHAQILFALWDGEKARGAGGTADQVEWYRRGYSPRRNSMYSEALSPLDPPEPGRMIWVHAVTAKIETLEGLDFPGCDKRGGTSNIRSILDRIDNYNRDVVTYNDAVAKAAPLAETERAGALELTNDAYRCADALSVRYAKTVRWTDNIVYLLALFAVIAFNFVSAQVWAPWVYLGITTVMLLLGLRIWFGRKDNRLLEYRSFAEAMRILFFWRASGLKKPVWLPFLSRQSGVVHWIRHAVRTTEFCQDCLLVQEKGAEGAKASSFVQRAWVDNQKAWFTGRQEYHLERSEFWNRWARIALGASFAMTIVLAVLTALPFSGKASLWAAFVKPDKYADYWQAALGLFTAAALVARGFASRKAHLELAKQYASQKLLFENASRILGMIASGREPEWRVEDVLEKLGQDALREQAEWLWLRHTRPFEAPS